eukprot:761082-Hanusia_phi.AAC.3
MSSDTSPAGARATRFQARSRPSTRSPCPWRGGGLRAAAERGGAARGGRRGTTSRATTAGRSQGRARSCSSAR